MIYLFNVKSQSQEANVFRNQNNKNIINTKFRKWSFNELNNYL